MTVIAFDGRTVAADKLAVTNSGYKSTTTKIFRADDAILGFAGSASHGVRLRAWFVAGADPEKFPEHHNREDSANMIVFRAGKRVLVYENSPVPIVLEDEVFAEGIGRHAALAAMLMGADARRAIEVACKVNDGCGHGVDVLELNGDAPGSGGTCASSAGATASQ